MKNTDYTNVNNNDEPIENMRASVREHNEWM